MLSLIDKSVSYIFLGCGSWWWTWWSSI